MYKLGHNFFIPSKELVWDYRKEQNPHAMIIGKSGSGKTYLLRNILKNFTLKEKGKINVFVIDFHGDLEIEDSQTIEYNKNDINSAGIGIFEFDYFSKAGGIYNRVDELVKIFENSFFPQMSPLRKALLKKLLLDVYYKKGYDPDNPATWKDFSKLPTLDDLGEFINTIVSILKEMKETKQKANYSASLVELRNLLLYKEDYSEDELKTKANESFERYKKELFSEKQPIEKELGIKDFNFYLKKNVLNSLENLEIYINAMMNSKIFSKNNPILQKDKNVFRFNLKYLEDETMLFIANLIIQRVFTKLRMKYEYKKGTNTDINTYIVIDESKLILPNREKNNDLHFVNRIVSEARKYGLGIILASQRIAHYSQEMISNISTKIVLNTDESEQPIVKKKLGIKDSKIFEQIKSKQYGVAYCKSNRIDEVIKLN